MHLGFTGVMIDASSKPFDENVAITKEVVHEAHALGVGVEAELGHILSQEHGQTAETVNKDQTYTHPQEAKKFADLTGVDALAISFGTAHGLYLEKPVLDLNRITPMPAGEGHAVCDARWLGSFQGGIPDGGTERHPEDQLLYVHESGRRGSGQKSDGYQTSWRSYFLP
jgi:hypothetical protein